MPKEGLTREEQETIINFNRAEDLAEVYTHDPRILRRLRKVADEFPEVCALVETDGYGGETYTIHKKYIRIGTPVSEERREAARENANFARKTMVKTPVTE